MHANCQKRRISFKVVYIYLNKGEEARDIANELPG